MEYDEMRKILKGKNLSDDESVKVIMQMLDSNNAFVLIPCKQCPEVMIMQFHPDESVSHNLMMVNAALLVHEESHLEYKT